MKGRILLVDDDALVRDVVARHFQVWGYQVSAAKDLARARALARKLKFAAVLLDNALPGAMGVSAIRELSQECAAPVVLMTGHYDEEVKRDALLLGAAAVLKKPFDFDRLQELLADVIARR